jgi:hypothetical protein
MIRCFVLIAAVSASAGCVTELPIGSQPGAEYRLVVDIPAEPTDKIDLLFVVDDSDHMTQRQFELAMSFERLVDYLTFADLGLPDLHVAVVSTDLGVGMFAPDVPTCTAEGGSGMLVGRTGARATSCGPVGDNFIRHNRDPDRVNYEGELSDSFACISQLGSDGCDYEQPLEAMKIALSDDREANIGFLRPDAALGVVVLTDEDDCSARSGQLFDPLEQTFTTPDADFRCFESGVICKGDDVSLPGQREGCVPNEDSLFVNDVANYVGFLKGLKADQDHVVVAGMIGDPSLVEVELDFDGDPLLAPACHDSAGTAAYPGVRLQGFLDGFDEAAELSSLCNSEPLSALATTSRQLRQAMGTTCLAGRISDVDPIAAGRQVDCLVSQIATDGTRIGITECDSRYMPGESSVFPCYTIDRGAEHCGDFETQLALKVWSGPSLAPAASRNGPNLALPGVRVIGECLTDDR